LGAIIVIPGEKSMVSHIINKKLFDNQTWASYTRLSLVFTPTKAIKTLINKGLFLDSVQAQSFHKFTWKAFNVNAVT
jgi:hypothetical protein